jgi:hypothetical protein
LATGKLKGLIKIAKNGYGHPYLRKQNPSVHNKYDL